MFMPKISTDLNRKHISMNSKTLSMIETFSNSVTIQFGNIKKTLPIEIDHSLRTYEMILPSKLSEQMTIPDLPYEIRTKNGHFILGPVIGYLPSKHYYQNPNEMIRRFSQYHSIKGLIIIFKKNAINKDNHTVTGYYYNPDTNSFINGTFPLPNSIYSRVPIDPSLYRYLKEQMGQTIFNYPYNLDKELFYSFLSEHAEIKSYLPETAPYQSIDSITSMVSKYGSVYLKPSNLSRGRGIYQVKKTKNGFIITNQFNCKHVVKGSLLPIRIARKLLAKPYLVQQDIPFIYEGNKVDFRAYFIKDQNGDWQYQGTEAKIAKKGSIISNSKNRLRMIPGEKALRDIFGMSGYKAYKKINELTKICKKALAIIEDHNFHLGELAIDFIIDHNHKIWLLEFQLNFAAEKKALRSTDEQRLLPVILPAPFFYAKALSGFTSL